MENINNILFVSKNGEHKNGAPVLNRYLIAAKIGMMFVE